MKKRSSKSKSKASTRQQEPIDFFVPFALPGNDEELNEQMSCYTELRRIIAGWKGAKWEPWGAPKSILLPVPESLATLSEGALSDLDGDTLDELRLFRLARLSAIRLYEAGRIDRLAKLGLFITRDLERAKEHFPDAERAARESYGAWPVEVKVGSKGARVPDLGRSGCRGWNLKPGAFAGDSKMKSFALGLYATIQFNREIFRLVNGRWKSLARWCQANDAGYPLSVPLWADSAMNLPQLTRENWHKWQGFITRDWIREVMGEHPAWLRLLSEYEGKVKDYRGKRAPESLAHSHLKKYVRDLLHTKSA